MNVKLLRKVKAHILAEPRRFRMGFMLWKEKPSDDFKNMPRPPRCGTAGCIAGWVCVLSGVDPEQVNGDKAAQLLGIDEAQRERLFFDSPEGFEKMWRDDGRAETARLCAKRIDLFIRTKGKE